MVPAREAAVRRASVKLEPAKPFFIVDRCWNSSRPDGFYKSVRSESLTWWLCGTNHVNILGAQSPRLLVPISSCPIMQLGHISRAT